MAYTTQSEEAERISRRFLELTGLTSIEFEEAQVGHGVFLHFRVGQDAPLYRWALTTIDNEIGPEHQLHGSLTLSVSNAKFDLNGMEAQILGSLITRSLRVTSDQPRNSLVVEFVPFRGGEHRTITQPANHAILGRRGVGKSSLILLGVRKVASAGHIPVWLDLQPYRGRREPRCTIEILREILHVAQRYVLRNQIRARHNFLADAVKQLDTAMSGSVPTEESIQAVLPRIRPLIRDFTQALGKQIYVFLDDAHLVSPELQPFLFDAVHSVLKGAGGWLNVAGVKNLTRLYDPHKGMGLQIPHDAQPVNLDLTLTDPKAAKDHLTAILEKFLRTCGINRTGKVMPDAAVERLVWCSAGVPRDFLWLFHTAMQHALQNRRPRVGVQEINMAVGEFGHQKMEELATDTAEGSSELEGFLDRLQAKCLDELKSNSFLVKEAPRRQGYKLLQKLMDLRLVHLLHPSITPRKAGERHEAYLLDYSFYTGVRRRHGLEELRISSDAPPRYSVLRRLPKIDVEEITHE
jgi:hypothetical protein